MVSNGKTSAPQPLGKAGITGYVYSFDKGVLRFLHMIDHTGLYVSNVEVSKKFYLAALAPMSFEVLLEYPGGCGLGSKGSGDDAIGSLWLVEKPVVTDKIHFAFRVRDKAAVQAFYEAALANGGTDNGAPGIRAEYSPGYFAAFVRDPDGHNVEVVCHLP